MAAVCAGVLVVGSPWVQRPLVASASQDYLVSWMQQVVSAPEWKASSAEIAGVGDAAQWSMVASVATLLIGALALLPGLMTRAEAGRVRWTAAIGAGALIGALSGLLGWAVLIGFGHSVGEPHGQLFVSFVPTSAVFGALMGAVTGLLHTGDALGDPAAPATAAADRGRAPAPQGLPQGFPQERRSGIDTVTDASPAPLGQVPGDTTRYLCAAAYTDRSFARTVVEKVLADTFGAVAPSPGLDLLPVARHCLTAQELRYRRDLRLSAVFAGMALVAPGWLLVAGLVLSALSGCVTDAAFGGAHRTADRGRGGINVRRSGLRLTLTGLLLLLLCLALGIGISSLHLPGLLQWLLGGYLYGVPALFALGFGLLAAFTLVARDALATDELLRTTLRRPVFRPDQAPEPAPAAPWIEDRLEALAEAQQGNVTLYSGWSPFTGFAAPEDGWSLSIPILPASHPLGGADGGGAPVTEFDAWELVEQLRLCWSELSQRQPDRDHDRLAGLLVQDRVFVHGATVGRDPRFLPERGVPVTLLEPEQLRQIALSPSGTARHWLTGCLPMWGGDVVPSMLLNVDLTGRTVHVQCNLHTLGSVRGSYHAVDLLPAALTAGRRTAVMLSALPRTRSLLFGAPFGAVDHAGFEKRRNRRMLRDWQAIEHDGGFDYGARLSIRERVTQPTYANYYQPHDGKRVLNALTRHTLAALQDFLDAHGVDTTDFQQQQQTILNHGIIQQGGSSTVENLAVGQGASVSPAGPAKTEPATSR
ncbi:hypothetical protein GXW83_23300 [Streptacidiphilus sp. PB12-B1b]|uniref:hypothetical protein n=1 Tax=Streptacidiphilus sp. PB12-B1b TaxID=2705012 RepID=UPI0015F9C5D8|nr:hypothetical protein [Streptacidiphilus sp. PB12-B1b]QMU78192.1 hypothetical protein GXW83_23300 [Streptacidiphilus sp. PB12-B1b]